MSVDGPARLRPLVRAALETFVREHWPEPAQAALGVPGEPFDLDAREQLGDLGGPWMVQRCACGSRWYARAPELPGVRLGHVTALLGTLAAEVAAELREAGPRAER